MTATSRRAEQHATNNTTVTFSTLNASTGDLVVFVTAGGDATPTILLTPTAGTVGFESLTENNSTTYTLDSSNYDRRYDDAAESGGYIHIWSVYLHNDFGSGRFKADISNWSTGARRWAVLIINPGSGNNHFPFRSTRQTQMRVYEGEHDNTDDDWQLDVVSGLDPSITVPCAMIVGGYNSAAKLRELDVDSDGDYTLDNATADAGDGAGILYIGGVGAGTNQQAWMGEGFWDSSSTIGTGTPIRIKDNSASGDKAGVAVLYSIGVPAKMSGKGATASSAKATITLSGFTFLSGKAATADSAKASLNAAMNVGEGEASLVSDAGATLNTNLMSGGKADIVSWATGNLLTGRRKPHGRLGHRNR